MPRDSLSEFQLLDFAKRSPKPDASETSSEAPCCKPRADLGAYLTIVVALATYGAIAWQAGWLDRWLP